MATYKEIKIIEDFQKLPFTWMYTTSILINILIIVIGAIAEFILPPEIPILYGLPRGAEQLISSFGIVIPPLVAIIFTIINIVISIKIDSLYLKRALAFTSLLISFFSIVAIYKTIFLVGSF